VIFCLHNIYFSFFWGSKMANLENLREAAWFIAILVVLALILLTLAICCCCAQCRVSGRYSVQKREKQFGLIGSGDESAGEYQKFLEYHHLGGANDPPTISVSLADSTLEGLFLLRMAFWTDG
jgi:hypothetical protein